MVVGITVATYWEIRGLIRHLHMVKTSFNNYECKIKGLQLYLHISGIGQNNAKRSAKILAERSPSFILSTGFGGALQKEIKAGELIVDGSRSDSTLVERVMGIAEKNRIPVHKGTFWSSSSPLMTPYEKKLCGEKTGAHVVEMESQAVFEVCRDKHIPFCSFRTVSDSIDQRIPAWVMQLGSQGQLKGKFFIELFRHPEDWLDFLRLASGSKKAEKNLLKVILYFVRALS